MKQTEVLSPTITKLIIPEIKVDVNWLCISLYRESTDWRPGSGLHHENKEMAFEPIENVSLYRKTYKKIGPFRRTHQLKPLQYFKLTSWILFCQQNCITHGHAAKCFQRGQLSFNALCTPQTPTPLDFSPDVSPDVTDYHFLFFFSFFSWLKLHTSLKLSLPLWTTARASIAQTHIGIFLKHCDSLKTVATQQYLISP